MTFLPSLLLALALSVAAREQQLPLLPIPATPQVDAPSSHDFSLRHIFHKGSHVYPRLLRRADVHSSSSVVELDQDGVRVLGSHPLRVRTRPAEILRMTDRSESAVDGLLEAARCSGEAVSLPSSAWTLDAVDTPNATDKETVISMARMAANAYVLEPHTGDWADVGGGFNYTEDFGWENDGLRGHVFADTQNRTIVIGLKGTSPAVFDGADTTGNDKLNDNLFGSCCCGQGGHYFWKQVCDCQTSTYTCNSTCLVKNLREKGHYYQAAKELYHNVTELYPNADVWLTGHSLGGVVTSLLGLTFGLPTFTYEAFPDALAASRLGLPTPPGYRIGSARPHTGTYHFGHTADPIYMGTCNAASSFCTIAGYAFQGQCHTGQTCTYDTVGDLGWRVGIGTHKIQNVIRDVLEKYDDVASCETDVDCVDCFNWEFFESNGTESTTSRTMTATATSSSTTSRTRSRTETCATPGWWGCLDESTTTPVTTTQTVTTTTCLTPGWFGCKDEVTTTWTTTRTRSPDPASSVATVTATATRTERETTTATRTERETTTERETVTSTTTTCETPGRIFGCRDATSGSTTTSCATPGRLYGCRDGIASTR